MMAGAVAQAPTVPSCASAVVRTQQQQQQQQQISGRAAGASLPSRHGAAGLWRTCRRGLASSTLPIRCQAQGRKGFGPPPTVPKKPPATKPQPSDTIPSTPSSPSPVLKREPEEEPEDDIVPEVVMNRILKRLSFTVGVPTVIALAFFPLFYYLKVVKKVDIPDWLPLITSSLTFGVAGLGITYGVVSTSWDPLREGSLLGWEEAKTNWPNTMDTIKGKGRRGRR